MAVAEQQSLQHTGLGAALEHLVIGHGAQVLCMEASGDHHAVLCSVQCRAVQDVPVARGGLLDSLPAKISLQALSFDAVFAYALYTLNYVIVKVRHAQAVYTAPLAVSLNQLFLVMAVHNMHNGVMPCMPGLLNKQNSTFSACCCCRLMVRLLCPLNPPLQQRQPVTVQHQQPQQPAQQLYQIHWSLLQPQLLAWRQQQPLKLTQLPSWRQSN